MEIEHKLIGTQVHYGYIWWRKQRENQKYRKVFPEGTFTIDLEGKKFAKHVDWNMGRISIGKKIMQKLFKQNDVIVISKQPDGSVKIRMKINQVSRPSKALCENCKYWKKSSRPLMTLGISDSTGHNLGECRRYPPTVYPTDKGRKSIARFNSFPIVEQDAMCGEFESKEE